MPPHLGAEGERAVVMADGRRFVFTHHDHRPDQQYGDGRASSARRYRHSADSGDHGGGGGGGGGHGRRRHSDRRQSAQGSRGSGSGSPPGRHKEVIQYVDDGGVLRETFLSPPGPVVRCCDPFNQKVYVIAAAICEDTLGKNAHQSNPAGRRAQICMKFQMGRCNMQTRCQQIHASKGLVSALRQMYHEEKKDYVAEIEALDADTGQTLTFKYSEVEQCAAKDRYRTLSDARRQGFVLCSQFAATGNCQQGKHCGDVHVSQQARARARERERSTQAGGNGSFSGAPSNHSFGGTSANLSFSSLPEAGQLSATSTPQQRPLPVPRQDRQKGTTPLSPAVQPPPVPVVAGIPQMNGYSQPQHHHHHQHAASAAAATPQQFMSPLSNPSPLAGPVAYPSALYDTAARLPPAALPPAAPPPAAVRLEGLDAASGSVPAIAAGISALGCTAPNGIGLHNGTGGNASFGSVEASPPLAAVPAPSGLPQATPAPSAATPAPLGAQPYSSNAQTIPSGYPSPLMTPAAPPPVAADVPMLQVPLPTAAPAAVVGGRALPAAKAASPMLMSGMPPATVPSPPQQAPPPMPPQPEPVHHLSSPESGAAAVHRSPPIDLPGEQANAYCDGLAIPETVSPLGGPEDDPDEGQPQQRGRSATRTSVEYRSTSAPAEGHSSRGCHDEPRARSLGRSD